MNIKIEIFFLFTINIYIYNIYFNFYLGFMFKTVFKLCVSSIIVLKSHGLKIF